MTSAYWWARHALALVRLAMHASHKVMLRVEWQLFSKISGHTIAITDMRSGHRAEYR